MPVAVMGVLFKTTTIIGNKSMPDRAKTKTTYIPASG